MIRLAPLSAQDLPRVAHIHVEPAQEIFCGTVAEAFETAEPNVDFHAILSGDHPVGFFKLDRAYAVKHPFAAVDDLGLRAYMIDAASQGRGHGTAALRALPGHVRQHYPDRRTVWLTVNFQNRAAYACYLNAGFTDTGETWPHGGAGPQHVMCLPIAAL